MDIVIDMTKTKKKKNKNTLIKLDLAECQTEKTSGPDKAMAAQAIEVEASDKTEASDEVKASFGKSFSNRRFAIRHPATEDPFTMSKFLFQFSSGIFSGFKHGAHGESFVNL